MYFTEATVSLVPMMSVSEGSNPMICATLETLPVVATLAKDIVITLQNISDTGKYKNHSVPKIIHHFFFTVKPQ